jgi:hypothetical protein
MARLTDFHHQHTYKLANEDDEELTNAWNIQQLRRFYP